MLSILRRAFPHGVLLIAIVLAACDSGDPVSQQAAPTAAVASAKPDVILITLDTTRRDHIGCYGRTPSVTPAIDRLCARALRFDNALAVAPVTLPAHASMMTGRYPPAHGARYNGETRLLPEASTLAERLKSHGYATAAFVSSFVLDHRFGLDQGFDRYDDRVDQATSPFAATGNERSATGTVDAALAAWSARPPAQPQFLWVHLFDAHTPYAPVPGRDAGDAERYAEEIRRVDHEVGRLLDAVSANGREPLIVLLADHGESLGEHGERTHGLFVYDATVRIPWMIAGPGVAAGVYPTLASQIDLLPTVLGVLGLPVPEGIDGRDLRAAPRSLEDSVYLETVLPYYDFALAPLHALRALDRKYVLAPRPEFYRLDRDPHESRNVYGEDAQADVLVQRLDNLMLDWPAVGQSASHVDDADAVARLRSLGYLSGSDLGMEGLDPKDAVAVVRAHQDAAEAASAGRVDEAIAHLDEAVAAMPSARGALYLRARLLAQSGRRDAALRDIEQVNARVPSADSILLQAQLLVSTGRIEEAQPLLDLAAQRDPGHGGVLVVRGDLAVVAGDVAAARGYYEQALALDEARVGRQARGRLSRLPK
ncbi:MAG: sulfatase-like hydrolase/transferase [Rhodanobacteraceae bacterium]|nr:sulfatase-like hydrolase/transferase [Rhodanobacteraceae bacterium]MBL0042311.1 sulfatase-like hydrolase/transferase [Xanthomonadales bacterium]